MGVYVGAGVDVDAGVGVLLGVEVAKLGRIDGMFEDNVQLSMITINASPRMMRAIRFMLLLILVKQKHVKLIV